MKRIILLLVLTFGPANAQYFRLVPNKNIFVSQGITKSVLKDTAYVSATLGVHYFFNVYYGWSIQTNVVGETGWYNDFRFADEDVTLIGSIGYSIPHNCVSYSARIGIRWQEFFE